MEGHLSTASLLAINEEKYSLIRDGIPVTVSRPQGQREAKTAILIDFVTGQSLIVSANMGLF